MSIYVDLMELADAVANLESRAKVAEQAQIALIEQRNRAFEARDAVVRDEPRHELIEQLNAAVKDRDDYRRRWAECEAKLAGTQNQLRALEDHVNKNG